MSAVVVAATLLLATACGFLGERQVHPQVQRWCADEPNKRLIIGMNAGIDEFIRRGGDFDQERPAEAYLPDGGLHPLVERFAFDGDGRLRGEGPSMEAILQECELATTL
jgi:hypothetical protein